LMHAHLCVKFARCVKGGPSSVAFGDTFPQGKAYRIARLCVKKQKTKIRSQTIKTKEE